jgi:hypothetical protein
MSRWCGSPNYLVPKGIHWHPGREPNPRPECFRCSIPEGTLGRSRGVPIEGSVLSLMNWLLRSVAIRYMN